MEAKKFTDGLAEIVDYAHKKLIGFGSIGLTREQITCALVEDKLKSGEYPPKAHIDALKGFLSGNPCRAGLQHLFPELCALVGLRSKSDHSSFTDTVYVIQATSYQSFAGRSSVRCVAFLDSEEDAVVARGNLEECARANGDNNTGYDCVVVDWHKF